MGWASAEDRRKYGREYMKGLRHWRKAHHLCGACGKKDAYTMAGRYRCADCCEKRRKTPIEYIPAPKSEPKPPRRREGYCYICGKPWMDGTTKWGGDQIKLCEEHYRMLSEASVKGRESHLKKYGKTWGQIQYARSQKLRELQNTGKSLLPRTSYN